MNLKRSVAVTQTCLPQSWHSMLCICPKLFCEHVLLLPTLLPAQQETPSKTPDEKQVNLLLTVPLRMLRAQDRP